MKSFLRAAAATGVAAATVVTGLSFGPAAMADSQTNQLAVGTKGAPFKLLADITGYPAVLPGGSFVDLLERTSSLEEARAVGKEIVPVFVTSANGVDYWNLKITSDNGKTNCLYHGITTGVQLYTCGDNIQTKSNFQWSVDNGLLKTRDGYYVTSSLYSDSPSLSYTMANTRPSTNKFVDLPSKLTALYADVKDTSLTGKTATLDGFVEDSATSVKVSYTDNTGTAREFTAAASGGKWSQALDKLKLGTNKVTLESYKDTEKLAENVIDVDLTVPAVKLEQANRYAKDGATKYAYQVSGGIKGATLQGKAKDASNWDDLGTIDADGTAYITDTDKGATSGDYLLREVFESTPSAETTVAQSAIVKDKLPKVQIVSATSFTSGSSTFFSYSIKGVPGSKVQDGPTGQPWAEFGTIPASGELNVYSTTRGPAAGQSWDFRQYVDASFSEKVTIAASDYKPTPVGATVKKVDIEAGTADLDGFAPANATDVSVEWTTKDGAKRTRNAKVTDGAWVRTLDELALGKTQVTLTAYEGSEVVAENTVEVDLPVTALTGVAAFSDDVQDVATITGTATPDTQISAFHGESTKPVATVMSNAKGEYVLPINPPGIGGTYDLTVTQKIRGEETSPLPITLDYGQGVEIASPAQGEELESGESLFITGKAQAGTMVQVTEKGKPEVILGQARSGQNGTYRVEVQTLQDREYTLVVSAQSKGANVTSAELLVNPGKSDVEAPTAEVTFDADVTKKATVSGTGVDGATITVKNGDTKIGEATVRDGEWSTEIDPIGAGTFPLTIEQTGIEGTQTTNAEADFGAGVAVTTPAGEVAPGLVPVSGTGQDGARVTVTAAGKTATTTVKDGTWSTEIEIAPGTTAVQVEATQQSKGALRTTASVDLTPAGAIEAKDVVITTPSDNTFVPGQTTTVGGTATPFADIDIRFQWNDTVVARAKADAKGNWSYNRQYAAGVTYVITATQKRVDGTTSTSPSFSISPEGSSVVAPTARVDFDADVTRKATVTGSGAEGATITVKNGDTKIGETTVKNGAWSTEIDPIGAGSYELTIEQTGVGGSTQSTKATADFGAGVAVTTPAGEVAPGLVPVSGTGQDGARVTVIAAGKTATTTVKDGTWSTEIEIAPGTTAVQVEATQQSKGALRTTASVDLTPAGAIEAKDVVITTPSDNTFVPGQTTTVGGTATPFADIDIRFQWNDTVVARAKADAKGNWSYNRQYAAGVRYQITATQKRVDGTTSVSNRFDLSEDGAQQQQDVAITSPANHAFTPLRTTTVSGTASPNAKIDIRFQWNDTIVASTTADSSGNWSYNRQYAAGVTYQITATQTREDGTTSVSPVWTISDETARRPLFLSTPEKTSTFVPNEAVLFSGTGTPGATIVVTAPKFNDAVVFTTTVNTNGEWTFKRGFAAGVEYDLTLTQTTSDGTTDKIEGVQLTPAS